MDDGDSPLLGLAIFVFLAAANGILYGFLAALEEITENQVRKREEEGSKHASWLLGVMDSPYKTKHSIQVMTTFLNCVLGISLARVMGNQLINALLPKSPDPVLAALCYVLAMLACVFLLAVFGIIAPQKIAARRPEAWLFALAGPVRGAVRLLKPYTALAELLSNLAVRLTGVDPNASFDDVTEEEIISMVKEGHEQGVLLESEAEMIHNIFAFDEKEAKDIMTHRKHVAAIDGKAQLRDVLEFILQGNNSRFPVYKEDIDNIIGIIHMKDVMIESRNGTYLDWAVEDIPGLVREAVFIPETRNINDLFKMMQSQKNHIAIVVDEYGQTAGIVAMEDILEEIVGNIFDEYDKEETMISRQEDGGYLMRGLAPFDDVCEILQITPKDTEYETLNGYLISLIGKIPGEQEQFELDADGWHFHVLSVRDKTIHTVRVTKAAEEPPEDGAPKEEEAAGA